jgi:hypothetical protein
VEKAYRKPHFPTSTGTVSTMAPMVLHHLQHLPNLPNPLQTGRNQHNCNSIAWCVACLHSLLGFVPTASLSWQLTNDLWLHAFQPAVQYQNFRTEVAEGVGEVAGVLFRVAKYAYEKVRGGPRLSDPFLLVLSWPCCQADCTASGLLSCCFAGT